MRPRVMIALVALLVVVSVGSLQATAGGGERFTGTLSGFEETPTLSVPGTGTIRVTLSGDGETISYRLRYSGLTGPALFAHIHLGRPAIAGGVIAFLCDSADTAPDGVTVPECPGAGGQASGTIQASDVRSRRPGDRGRRVRRARRGPAREGDVRERAHRGIPAGGDPGAHQVVRSTEERVTEPAPFGAGSVANVAVGALADTSRWNVLNPTVSGPLSATTTHSVAGNVSDSK